MIEDGEGEYFENLPHSCPSLFQVVVSALHNKIAKMRMAGEDASEVESLGRVAAALEKTVLMEGEGSEVDATERDFSYYDGFR